MIYNFYDDFCNMKTTVYLYNEYTDKEGNLRQLPLSRPLKEDKFLIEILGSFKLNWIFEKNPKYGNNIKDVTLKARTHSHGSLEYNDIKMRMPGYTWAGTIKTELELNEETQEFYDKRKPRSIQNTIPNGLVCIEFDDVESNKVDELIQKALAKFPHLVYAGRTLSNKLFCMHRGDSNLNSNNYERYYKELAVLYHNELGIEHDAACKDISRCRYMCDQYGARASMEYCDFEPSNDIEVEYDKLFRQDEISHIKRASEYVITPDDNVYEYDKEKGFYYGHGKNHKMHIGDIIVPVPTITQMINTLLAIGKTRDEISDLWKDKLNYYNYNTRSNNVEDPVRLTNKFKIEGDEYKIGSDTYLFLQMFFPDIVGCKSMFLAKNEFLCDRYYDFLKNAILSNNKILIHGDTGIGKTYFANRLSEDHNVIVIVPYIAHMNNYPAYHQIELNKIDESIGQISNGVIIWDRFIKLYDRNLIDEKSIIIIDESHKLFLDQTYRSAAVNMNRILNNIQNHICYVSATPINEINVEKTYRFEKERRHVKINHLKIVPDEDTHPSSTLAINAILHLIYGNINYYDHIFVASDIYAQKIYDRLYGKYDCQLIRASQKDSVEYLDLMKTQLMKHKIIIGTCISYESLNFNNRGEKILTITDMNENTSAQIITQIAGRVRFSYNKVYLIELIKEINEIDYKEMAEFYNELEKIKSKYNLYSKKHYVQSYADELEEVSKWFYENNDINTIKENLPSYINWSESEILAKNLSEKSPLNEQVKEYIVEHISKYNDNLNNIDIIIDDIDYNTFMFFNQNDFIKINEEGQSAYIIRENIRAQQYEYNKLSQYIDYKKINNMIINSNTLVKGINSDIKHIIDIISLNNTDYDKYIDELETYKSTIGYNVTYQILDRTIKDIKKVRKEYIKCNDKDELEMYNKIFDKYANKRIDKYNKRVEKGKKGTKQIKDIQTGKIYNSATDCANDIGKSNAYISKYKDRFIQIT